MRSRKRRELEVEILVELRRKELDVQCGDCAVVVRADWKRCVVRNVKSWIAYSEVFCVCGCTLHSYYGDAVPMQMLHAHFQEGDDLLWVSDDGPVMSFVRRALVSSN
jgi:hypothetical protein